MNGEKLGPHHEGDPDFPTRENLRRMMDDNLAEYDKAFDRSELELRPVEVDIESEVEMKQIISGRPQLQQEFLDRVSLRLEWTQVISRVNDAMQAWQEYQRVQREFQTDGFVAFEQGTTTEALEQEKEKILTQLRQRFTAVTVEEVLQVAGAAQHIAKREKIATRANWLRNDNKNDLKWAQGVEQHFENIRRFAEYIAQNHDEDTEIVDLDAEITRWATIREQVEQLRGLEDESSLKLQTEQLVALYRLDQVVQQGQPELDVDFLLQRICDAHDIAYDDVIVSIDISSEVRDLVEKIRLILQPQLNQTVQSYKQEQISRDTLDDLGDDDVLIQAVTLLGLNSGNPGRNTPFGNRYANPRTQLRQIIDVGIKNLLGDSEPVNPEARRKIVLLVEMLNGEIPEVVTT